jgi:virulence-associated protein VapD
MDKILTRKAINFDLDTKALQQNYHNASWNNAYDDVRILLAKFGFVHRQGSGYVSSEPKSDKDVLRCIKKMCIELTWLSGCVNKLDVTEVGETYDLTSMIKKAVKKHRNPTKQ